MSHHCEGCGEPDIKSQYRCSICQRWICKHCFDDDAKLCPSCGGEKGGLS